MFIIVFGVFRFWCLWNLGFLGLRGFCFFFGFGFWVVLFRLEFLVDIFFVMIWKIWWNKNIYLKIYLVYK